MKIELIVPLILYLVIVLGIGVWANRKRLEGTFIQDYFIGNRSMGGLVLAMTLVATYTSASSFIGGPGAAYNIGLGWVLLAMIQIPTVWLTLGVLGKKFAIIARKVNAVTINDMLWARYQSKAVVIIGSITIICAFIATMVVQFVGGARLLETATGLSYQQGLLLFAMCVLCYTVIGGFRAVVITDTVQGMMMIIGTLVLLGGVIHYGHGLPALMNKLQQIDPKLITPYGAGDFLHLPFMFSFWILVCFGVIGLPHSAVRCLAYKDSRALHKAMIIGTIVTGLLMFGMTFAGVLGRAIVPALPSPDNLMPTLMLTVLPPWLAGIFLAAPMAAIMSTVDSQLIQASATLIKDLYLNYLRPSGADKAQDDVKLQRSIPRLSTLTTLIIGALVLVAALYPPQMIVWLNLMAFGGLEAVFFWPLVLGLYWPRANAMGSLSGMLFGAVSYIVILQWKLAPWGMHAIVPALLISLMAFLIGTWLTPPPGKDVLALFEKDSVTTKS